MSQGPKWTPAQREARLAKLVERNREGHSGGFLYEDADWMRSAYEDRDLTLRQIAAEAQCGLRTIARWMEIHGIETRSGDRRPKRGQDHHKWRGGVTPCPNCGAPRNTRSGRQQCLACREWDGPNNPHYRGDEIGYIQAHGRVVARWGKAAEHPCSHCGKQAKDWAYDHRDQNERSSPDGPYSTNPEHYMPLCKRCHKRFDNAHARTRA